MDDTKYLEELRNLLVRHNETEKDIGACLEYAENLLSLHLPVIFNNYHFAEIVGTSVADIEDMIQNTEGRYYSNALIRKKSGGTRTLQIPAMRLRVIQKWILKNILYQIPVSRYATGFVKNKSIVTNAEKHVGKDCVVNLDLENFFPTITQRQVFHIFYYYGYTLQLSYIFSKLCTMNGRLPQGAPTSPYLANMVCLKLDKRLSALAVSYEADYSRYADDITFSGKYGVQSILDPAISIIEDEGFSINQKKTHVAFSYQRQMVTGLNVSHGKVSVSKAYIKKFSQEIYYCQKYGPTDHLRHTHCDKQFYKDHMYGKAYFINMVDKEQGKHFLKMLDAIDWNQ